MTVRTLDELVEAIEKEYENEKNRRNYDSIGHELNRIYLENVRTHVKNLIQDYINDLAK